MLCWCRCVCVNIFEKTSFAYHLQCHHAGAGKMALAGAQQGHTLASLQHSGTAQTSGGECECEGLVDYALRPTWNPKG